MDKEIFDKLTDDTLLNKLLSSFQYSLKSEMRDLPPHFLPDLGRSMLSAWMSGCWEALDSVLGSDKSDGIMIEVLATNLVKTSSTNLSHEEVKKQLQANIQHVRRLNQCDYINVINPPSTKVH